MNKVAGRCKTAERFAFESNGEIDKSMGDLHFTILLVGSSGCGKESLINNFINYIFNVDLSDPFRFQLIDPSREENGVRVYDIHHSKGFRVNYSLTIIDTPVSAQTRTEGCCLASTLVRADDASEHEPRSSVL